MVPKKLDFTNSTRPELLKLNESFPDPETLRGSVLAWEDLEHILGLSRDENRFKTVIAAWRRHLRKDSGIWTRGDLHDVVGVGLRVLTHEEQVQFSGKRYGQAARRIVDGHAAAANADDAHLTDEGRRQKQQRILAGRHLHAAVIESRRFLPKTTQPPETRPTGKPQT